MLDTGAMVSGPLHGPSRRHPRVPDVDTWRQVWGPRPVFRPPAGGEPYLLMVSPGQEQERHLAVTHLCRSWGQVVN